VTGGVAPAPVQFINLTTGDVAGQAWDFGDGGSSSDVNPAHVYQTAGSYIVTLTVTGTDGTTGMAQAIITVTDPAPTAAPEVTLPPPTEEVTLPPPTEEVPTEVTPEVVTPPTEEAPPAEPVEPVEPPPSS
jgi:PKD repeat protein